MLLPLDRLPNRVVSIAGPQAAGNWIRCAVQNRGVTVHWKFRYVATGRLQIIRLKSMTWVNGPPPDCCYTEIRCEAQDNIMSVVFLFTIAAVVLVVASLVSGIISMGHGGKYDDEHATQFMFSRVGFQALAVLLVLLMAYESYV